jgi:hypothetical protein
MEYGAIDLHTKHSQVRMGVSPVRAAHRDTSRSVRRRVWRPRPAGISSPFKERVCQGRS